MCMDMHMNAECGALWLQTISRGDGGSIPPAAVSKLRQFFCRCVEPSVCVVDVLSLQSVL